MLKSLSSKKYLLLVLAGLLIAAAIIYLPGMTELGYYRDDWNNLFNAYTQGPEMLIQHYQSDRPADGYLLSFAYKIFGVDPFPYLICCLICRILSSFFLFGTLKRIWPNQILPSFITALFFLLYPGFLQQIDGIAYLPHQLAMLAIALSIYLSIRAISCASTIKRVILTIFSVILAVLEMFLMEYYIGLEFFRYALFFIWFFNQNNGKIGRSFINMFVGLIPWFVGAFFFFYWRSFLFSATRNGTDVSDTLRPFLDHPKHQLLLSLEGIIQNTFKSIFGAWTVEPYNVLNGINLKTYWPTFLESLLVVILCIGILFAVRKAKPLSVHVDDESNHAFDWRAQWLIVGGISTILTITPMVLAGREITFASSLDRFAYPSSLCASMFLVGLLSLISAAWVRYCLVGVMICVASMTQIVNKENYIKQSKLTQDFWWQLSWRAPDIREETLVIANPGAFSPEEDYETFVPIHLIYYPERDHVTIGTEVLNRNTIKNLEMGIVDGRKVREIFLWKDYSRPLAITKPSEMSCLQIIDGENPIYSENDWSLITEAGKFSDIDRVITDAEPHTPPKEIFGEEPEHGWCYYYEKMSLAQQQANWESVANLADEAIASGGHAEDPVEWAPLVQAYAYTGRIEDARPYGEILKTNQHLQYQACNYFKKAGVLHGDTIPSQEGREWLEAEFCK